MSDRAPRCGHLSMCRGEHCWRSDSQELKIHPLCPLGAGDVPWWEVATWLGWLTCPTVQGEVSVWEGGGEWQRSWARCVNGRGNYDAERQKGTLANASSERERQLSAWSKSPCEFKTASTQTQALKKTQVLHFFSKKCEDLLLIFRLLGDQGVHSGLSPQPFEVEY